jgi:hypothetical protein
MAELESSSLTTPASKTKNHALFSFGKSERANSAVEERGMVCHIFPLSEVREFQSFKSASTSSSGFSVGY